MDFTQLCSKVIEKIYEQNPPPPDELGKHFGVLPDKIFAILLYSRKVFEDTDIQDAIDEYIAMYSKTFKEDYDNAIRNMDELIEKVKEYYSGEAFITGDKILKGEDVKKEEKPKEEKMEYSDIKEIIQYHNTLILKMLKMIEDMRNDIEEMKTNVGFSKYASIKNFIDVMEEFTTDQLVRVFGSYAKKVLYKLVEDGYVERVSRGVWRVKNKK